MVLIIDFFSIVLGLEKCEASLCGTGRKGIDQKECNSTTRKKSLPSPFTEHSKESSKHHWDIVWSIQVPGTERNTGIGVLKKQTIKTLKGVRTLD